MRYAVSLAAIAMFAATAPASAVVIHSLPTVTPSDWSRFNFNQYSAGTNPGGETLLQTAPGTGVGFGWFTAFGAPARTPGNSSDGNYLSLTTRFSPQSTYGGPVDWYAYFDDGVNFAQIVFNPTDCNGNQFYCYDSPGFAGVGLMFADATASSGYRIEKVSLDTSVNHTYELLMKDGGVQYRVDGVTYVGDARSTIYGYKDLFIGDDSGSTQTGAGAMTISDVVFDTAPTFSLSVPEPASWALMIGGFGLIGASARRRRSVAVSA